MLVLSRKPGESIQIGDAIVRVVSISRSKVLIGIEAPPAIRITRIETDKSKATSQA